MSGFKVYDEETEWPEERPSETIDELVKSVDFSRVSARIVGNSRLTRLTDISDRLALPNLKTPLEARARFRIDKEWLSELGKPFAASLPFLSHQKFIRAAFERELEAKRLEAMGVSTPYDAYQKKLLKQMRESAFACTPDLLHQAALDRVHEAQEFAWGGFLHSPYVFLPEHSLRVPGIYKITSPKLKDISKSTLLYGQFPFVFLHKGE